MKPRSDTLFHFTRNVETLKSILKYGFWPRYSLEDFNWYSSSIGLISYPMVCFCDIPLARISDHIGFYGDFGIGVSRTWADTNRLNPLVYLANDTPVSLALSRLLNNNLTADNGYYQNSANDINSIISFVKPVWGYVNVNGLPAKKEFYQENEWRYVPLNNNLIKPWISKEEHLNPTNLQAFNEQARMHGSLTITPHDIKYIFVKDDSDIPGLVDYVHANLGQYSGNDLKILNSRIISTHSISQDI